MFKFALYILPAVKASNIEFFLIFSAELVSILTVPSKSKRINA